MANARKSADDLIAQITAQVRQDVLRSLEPSLRKLKEATDELSGAVSKAGGRRRPGRPPGKRGPGRPPGKRGPGRPPKSASKTGQKRTPRGALKSSVQKILASSSEPLRLSQVRDRLMRLAVFRDRNPKVIYAQIVHAVQSLDGVKKTGRGLYTTGSGSAPSTAAGKKPGPAKKVGRPRKKA